MRIDTTEGDVILDDLYSDLDVDSASENLDASDEDRDNEGAFEGTSVSSEGEEEDEVINAAYQATYILTDVQPQLDRVKHIKPSLSEKFSSFSTESLIDFLRIPGDLSAEELDYIAELLKKKKSPTDHWSVKGKIRKGKKKMFHPQISFELGKFLRHGGSQSNPAKAQAEDIHAWAVPGAQILPRMDTRSDEVVCPGLFLRLWDKASKSRIDDEDHGFLSASSELPLRDISERCNFLCDHTYWRHRGCTQGISITSHMSMLTSEHILPKFLGDRQKTKMNCANLTLINGYAQIAAGYPILRVVDEMRHYNVVSRYGDQEQYDVNFFEHEYLVPYCIVPAAIIATYKWRRIDWYRKFAAPVFLAHERARLAALEANSNINEVESIFVDKIQSTDDLEACFMAPINKYSIPLAAPRQGSQKDGGDVFSSYEVAASGNEERRWIFLWPS